MKQKNSKFINKINFTKMKKIYFMFLAVFLSFNTLNVEKINAQITGIKNIPGNYATLAIAIANLNSVGVGIGGVTLNLLAGNPQTAPIGGYRIIAVGTAANTITIKGNGNTITASGSQPISSLKDAVFMIKGGDYITIDGFVIRENPLNTINDNGGVNNMTEWGIALLHASPTNGSQNNTIKNCTISLNKNYNNTFGIYSNTRHDTIDVQNASDITSAGGANSNNKIYSNNISNVGQPVVFVGSRNAAFMDSGNDIGGTSASTGNILSNWGNSSTFYVDAPSLMGIGLVSETAYNISYNSITTSVNFTQITGIGISMYTATTGIFTNSITYNTFTLSVSNASGSIFAINTPIGNINSLNLTMNISNNLFLNCSLTAASYSNFYGIQVAGSGKILNINDNIFQGNTSTATDGYFYGIFNNNFNATDSININNNQMGNNSGGVFSFGGGNFEGIRIALAASTTAAISISSNNFQGLSYTAASTGTLRFISDQATSCGSININSNTFTNLNVNTSGNITFISNGSQRNSGTYCNVNNNLIVTGFNNSGTGGVLRLYERNVFSPINTIETNSNNNFSNITLTGGTNLSYSLWLNNEICGKIISNNIFNNISGLGSGAVNVISAQGSDTLSSVASVSNNTISNISAGGMLTGISSDGSFRLLNIFDNNINSLSSTGVSVTGISQNNVILNIFRNKIYNLQVNNVNGIVNGVNLFSSKVNVYNNLIADLKAPLTNKTTDAIMGINIGYFGNVYFNTIYINAASSGANFSSSGIYHTARSSSDGLLNLRNNIIVNSSTPNGTGKTVAYKRSSNLLNNYSTTSNNNLFYAGVPGSVKLIFFDGTNSDQTISAYKTRVAPRDSNSFSENPNFLSVSGSNANFLHIDSTIATQIESGGINIPGITDDYDGNIRNVSTPDVGADEFTGTHTLNLTVLIQGFYNDIANTMIQDTVKVYLRNSTSPYSIFDSSKNCLNSFGTGLFNFPNAVNGVNYYIQIKHRNSIETWSKTTQTFSGNALTYNFTTANTKAYGDNMIQVDASPVAFAIYSGDVNQDGTIDASDVSDTDNDAFSSLSGYVRTDVTGDAFVDAADVSLVDNNALNSVSVIRP